jgi:recombination protein RecT
MTNNLSTVSGFSNVLKNYEKSIASLLQNKYGISVEQFYITCVNAVKKNPKLLNCDPKSLFGAILLSAECGLRPNTEEQHAFIIPYKGEAKFQVGYKGLIEMMYRNPRVKKIYAEAVFEKDEFDYWYGLNPDLKHKPYRGIDKGNLMCTYAICKLDDGETIFTVVEKNELDKIRSFSQSANSDTSKFSPYNNGTDVHHFMEIKSAIKKLSKMIPKAGVIEISKAVDYDSRFEGGATVRVEIPSDSEEIVQPEIISKTQINSLENAFDNIVDDSFDNVVLPENSHKVISDDIFEISKDDDSTSFDINNDTEDSLF